MSCISRYLNLALPGAVVLVILGAVARPAAANNDPLERMNRGIFWFNDQVDGYVLVPVAKGWDTIAPDRLQHSLAHFYDNLRSPIVAANNLLQGKFRRSASDIGRFAVNTTVGMLGFFDPATVWGLEASNEDFGQTLGKWGIPPGPYLVLPFVGPSNPRDAVGLAADSFSIVYAYFVPFAQTLAIGAVDVVNYRSLVLQDVEQLKEASIDYYAAVRNAYLQRRATLVQDGREMSDEEQEDLYLLEDDE